MTQKQKDILFLAVTLTIVFGIIGISLAVALFIPQGGTGQTSFPTSMLVQTGVSTTTGALTATSSPTVNNLTATGTLRVFGAVTFDTVLTVANGGTGIATCTDGGTMLGSGTGAVTCTAVLADGEILVGDGTTDPVAESGATLRTSIGVGTGDSPTFTGLTLTTLTVNGASTLSTTTVQGYFNTGIVVATSSITTNNFTVNGTLSLPASSVTNAMVSDTLTASDLVAGSEVVADSEVVGALTISGGTVNDSIIGGTTAAAGTFTNLTATASSTISSLWIGSAATTSKLAVAGSFATPVASTTGATAQLINWASGATQRIILQGNTNLEINGTSSNPQDGGRYLLKLQQDSTGSRTVNWGTSLIDWAGGNGATTSVTQTANNCQWIGLTFESRSGRYTALASSTPVACRFP